jgi:hypothetical protein
LAEGVVAPIRGARLELLDCGHEVPVEQPGQLAALIEDFGADVAAPSGRAAEGAARLPGPR